MEKNNDQVDRCCFCLDLATSVQAMSPAPLHQPDGMITQIREACGAGRVRINGVCVARTTKRQVAGVRDGVEALAFGISETPPDRFQPRINGVGFGRRPFTICSALPTIREVRCRRPEPKSLPTGA